MPHKHRSLNLSSTVSHYKLQLYWAAIRYDNTKQRLQQKSLNTNANVGQNSKENNNFFSYSHPSHPVIYTLHAKTQFLTQNYQLCRWVKNTRMSENGIT